MIRIGSLFAGIGGLELGLERAIPGASTAWQVEIDPFCRRVLERHWPQAVRHDDVRTFPTPTTERVDVICGGFPCQDLSVAGRGAGLDGERSGLFYEYVRIVRALRPRVVVMENVSALLARGLGRVLGELATLGYDVEWDCVPASAVGAPHQRDRLFIVALDVAELARHARGDASRAGVDGTTAHAHSAGQQEQHVTAVAARPRLAAWDVASGWRAWGEPPPAVRRVGDGLPAGMDRPRRRRPVNDRPRLHALGNAVVPQVAEVVGRRVAAILGGAA